MDDQVLRSALTSGVMVKRQDGSYHCLPCEKTPSEALPHLKGRDHDNYLVWYILQHPSPSQELLNALPLDVREAKRSNKIELVDRAHFSYKCRVCPKKNQFTGIEPLKSHLNGNDHKKAEKNMQVSSLVPSQTQSPAGPIHVPGVPQIPSPSYVPQHIPPYGAAQPTPLNTSVTPSLGAEVVPPEVKYALDGRVVERGSGSFYKCLMCTKDFTGVAPLLEHLRSEKHKKKAAQYVPDLSRLSITSDQPNQDNVRLESLPIGVGRSDQTDGQWTFPWIVRSTARPRIPSETVYRNLSIPRGLVLIFNYYFTGQGTNERRGAKRDSFNLKTLFGHMGYMVYLYEDLSKSDTEEKLRDQQENQYLCHFDSFIVFVLSHGKDDSFSCGDGEMMSLKNVRSYFTDNNCRGLISKPKLFFANYCRGNFVEPHIQYDSLPPPPVQQVAPRDMMTLYSCIDSFQAPRHEERGTVFVQVLCEVLAEHAHDMNMQDLIIKINSLTKTRGGATPESQMYDFKTFYFNPYQQ
ncbi:uncharacterized protein LOC123510132 isoform X2 [Portunus trituberculatus]|uniref:uncharacterized protein LOC123510132 isoform X2 n=1 Tax=Portunus trituberculatus TaxID=210409 RepID=UPI001E1CF37C|nr:uncharacterized protein LOC123510132 isoform X2 [Portunus trituberculatus]